MAQQGKKVLLIGCDPKERHDVAYCSVAKPAPRLSKRRQPRKPRAMKCEWRTCASSATGCLQWSSADPRWAGAVAVSGIIHGFETLEKLGFHDWDFDYVLLDFLGRCRLRRIWAADRAGHVSKSDRRRLQRPPVRSTSRTTSARRSSTSVGWAATSGWPAW